MNNPLPSVYTSQQVLEAIHVLDNASTELEKTYRVNLSGRQVFLLEKALTVFRASLADKLEASDDEPHLKMLTEAQYKMITKVRALLAAAVQIDAKELGRKQGNRHRTNAPDWLFRKEQL